MRFSKLIAIAALFFSAAAQASPSLITNSGDSSLTGATVYDFSADANQSFTSHTFGGAFTTSSSSGSLFIENTYSGQYASTGQYLASQFSVGPFTISFASGVSAFGFNWGAADYAWTLNAYSSGGSLLESLTVNPTYASNSKEFFGIATAGISYAT